MTKAIIKNIDKSDKNISPPKKNATPPQANRQLAILWLAAHLTAAD